MQKPVREVETLPQSQPELHRIPQKSVNLIQSFRFAAAGVAHAIRVERNLKIHAVLAVLVVLAGFYFGITQGEWLAIVICIGLMVSTELMNTAVEHLGDAVSEGAYNEYVRRAKDVSASACLVVAVMSVVVGLIVFFPRLLVTAGY